MDSRERQQRSGDYDRKSEEQKEIVPFCYSMALFGKFASQD